MPSLKTILCALDLSEHSQVVAEEASMLAKLSGAKIYAMYVAPTMTQYTGFHVAPSTIDGFVGEIVTGAENSMAEFVAKHFEGVEVEADVVSGTPRKKFLRQLTNTMRTSSLWVRTDAKALTEFYSVPSQKKSSPNQKFRFLPSAPQT